MWMSHEVEPATDMTTTDQTTDPPTIYQLDNNTAYIQLNRPDRLNAVTADLYDGIQRDLERAADEGARVVVL